MPISGNITIATYFILNKKDRAGKTLSRPFQAVLDEMKRQGHGRCEKKSKQIALKV